jgi:hypothetical protein
MSYPAHIPYLLVSLRSLRRYWQGQVDVHAWKESISYVRRIAMDPNLRIRAVEREPAYLGKNDQFLDKQQIAMGYDPGDVLLYLDADTTVNSSIDSIFDAVKGSIHFVATQFSNWSTSGGIVQGRLKELRQFPSIDQSLVEQVLSNKMPSVNGGVWCCRPNSLVLPIWHRWSDASKTSFICDEKVLHLMPLKFGPHEFVVFHGRWNCSPKYQPPDWPDEKVKIFHHHGDSNMRLDKSPKSYEMWWRDYRDCIKENVGGVCEWRESAESTNKWFRELKKNGLLI